MAKPDQPKKLTAFQRLDAIGIDGICDMIEQDKSYWQIAEEVGVPQCEVNRWIQKGQTVDGDEIVSHSARARAALIKAARWNDDQALKVLQDLPKDATPAQIAQAREIAQHRRWRAKSRSPKEYGDRVTHTGDIENPIAMLTGEQLDAKIQQLQSKIGSV